MQCNSQWLLWTCHAMQLLPIGMRSDCSNAIECTETIGNPPHWNECSTSNAIIIISIILISNIISHHGRKSFPIAMQCDYSNEMQCSATTVKVLNPPPLKCDYFTGMQCSATTVKNSTLTIESSPFIGMCHHHHRHNARGLLSTRLKSCCSGVQNAVLLLREAKCKHWIGILISTTMRNFSHWPGKGAAFCISYNSHFAKSIQHRI